MSDRDCNRCLYATRDGGCASWDCNFISISEAERALVRAEMSLPEPKTGRWIIGNKTSVFDLAGVETWAVRITCSECSFSLNFVEGHTAQYRFCPSCGARMEASDD